MLKNPQLLRVLRQPAIHDGVLATAITRNFTGQLSKLNSRGPLLRRHFASSTSRLPVRTQISQSWRNSAFRTGRQARQNSSQAEIGSQKPRSLSERMKEMSRKYGWVVVGIYLGLSALDFPFCFLAVRWFGTERIAELEHTVVEGFWALVERTVPTLKDWREKKEAMAELTDAAREGGEAVVKDAKKHEDASIWTQLLLAYGVHKSLIFLRIPATLAVTPKVVKTLRKWGWNIGKAK